MSKGRIGSSTYLIYTRKRKKRPADCKQCKNSSQLDGKIYCNISGNLRPVNKKWCKHYSGAYIKRTNNKKKGK